MLRNQPEFPESEFRGGLALRCPPRADSRPGRSVKSRLLEPVALSWIITAGQARCAGNTAAAHSTPLCQRFFCHQISEEQHAAGLQTAATGQAACKPPSWGQRGSSAQPEQRQGHRDGAGGTDPPMANTTVAGLIPHPKEVPSWGSACPNFSPMAAPESALQHPWSWKYSFLACITVVTTQSWDKIQES